MYFRALRFSYCTAIISSLLTLSICTEAIGANLPTNRVYRVTNDTYSCSPERSNDGPGAMQSYENFQARNFMHNDGALKRYIDAWNNPTCVFDDGRPIISVMSGAYSQAFRKDRDWSKSLSRIESLKKKYPKEAFVALAEMEYWLGYAWDARGSGYASSVSKDGWRLHKERMEKAEKVLQSTKSYSASMPIWYSAMINVQSNLGRPEAERDKVFLEGTKRYPTYSPIYFNMVNYFLPKWGGTWRTVDNLVKWSVEHTKAEEGMTMYARLYWVVDGSSEAKLFKDTFASWPKMKQGFSDLMARHPKSKWNLNNFAKFACMAGDKQTFLKLRKQIGEDVFDAAWPVNTSLDLCETKFGYAE